MLFLRIILFDDTIFYLNERIDVVKSAIAVIHSHLYFQASVLKMSGGKCRILDFHYQLQKWNRQLFNRMLLIFERYIPADCADYADKLILVLR